MQNPRVRKLFSTILGVGAVAGSLVLTSCEDEFTEADAIKAQQESLAALRNQEDSLNRIGARINYTVTVTTAGQGSTSSRTSAVASAEGATVTVTQAGETYTETAGKGGVATFKGLLYGQATVTVETEGHTTVTYTTTLGADDDYNNKIDNSVGTLIPVFPLTVEAGASMISGKAWAELDATNDAPEAAVGAKVRATISVNTVLNTYGRGTEYGRISNATYDGFIQEATVGEDGSYSLIMPNGNGADGQGFTPTVEFLPFTAKQKYVAMEDGKLVTMEKDVLFGGQNSTDHIESNLSSIYAEIEAPTAEAKGFAVKAELVAQTFNSDFYIDFQATGSGYASGDLFELSADKDGNIATFEVMEVDADGKITGIGNFVNSGGGYTTVPTITPKTVTGTGAEFAIDFTNVYNVVIDNPGSDYWVVPQVSMVYNDFTGRETVGNAFGSFLMPKDGQVGEKGQVINTVEGMEPIFTVVNPVAKQAVVEYVQVDEDGRIVYVDLNEPGAGYLTSPKITFKNTSGEEVSAAGVAVVNGFGGIEGIGITNPGSGFKQYANNTDHSDTFDAMNLQANDQPDTQKFKPGTTNTGVNFVYGTGAVQ